MPPVIVGIAAGVAAAGVVSTAAAIAIGIGAAALTYAATPKFDGGSFANEAFSQQQMLRSPVEPRRGIYGRAMVSGPLVFAEETGTDNAYLHLVIPLAGHRCDGVEKIYFGDEVAWANGALTSKYASVARLKIHLGNQTTSDPDLTAECSQWTNAHVGFGVTYLYARLKFDTKVFPNGVPNIKALVRGKQVFDPRNANHDWEQPTTWTWSDNWALCCLDYNRFESGVGAAAHEIDLSYFAAAANDSDQLVEYQAGKFEKRYTCNGTYNQDVSPSSIMEKMLTAGAGMHVYVSGQYRLYAGVYQGPEVLVLTEDDAAGDIDVRPYTPRAELCNAVRGTFVDPENFYQPTDFPPYESSYYRAQDDGEYIDHDLDLPFTQSVWTAQRLGKLYLEQKRAGMQISMPIKMIGVAVSVGKVVGLSLPRLGIDGTFQVVDWQFDYGKPVSLILVETSAELFDFAMGSYTERDLTPNVILPNPATVPTPVGLQYVEYQDDPQWQGELTWSAPANNSSYRYVIEVSNGLGEVIYQTNADATRLLLPKFDTGFYTVSVWALNLFANRSNVPATLTIGATLPAPVTGIEVIAGPLTLTLRPTTAAAIAQTTQFEVLGGLSNNIVDAAVIGTGKEAVWPDRHANTAYHVWARTVNNYGVSSWYGPVVATTSADNSSIIDLIGATFDKYTWFAWADDASGTGFTTVEALGDGKAYMGIATDKDTASPSGNWQEYTWTKIKTEIPPVFTPEEETKLDNLMAGKLPFAPDKDMLAAQDALNNPALANNLITALSLLNQGISAPALGGETPSGAQSKASSAQSAAIAAAATDATTKANNAKAAAESYALAKANLAETTAKAYADGIVDDEEARAIADATAKANAAQSAAIAAAAADATSKANNAKAQAEANAALDALNKANTAKTDAISTASTDATTKANNAKTQAISSAATDATTKANSAQSAAIAAAAADATTKANNAKAQAEASAALDALNKANTAKTDAINTAATDATNKVDAVKVGGVNLFENSANITIDRTTSEHGFFASIQHVIDKLDNDEPITISFDVDSVYGNSLHCYNSNKAGARVFSPTKMFQNFGPNKVRLAFTTKIVNNGGTINSPGNTWIEFYSIYGTGDFWKVSKLKIERGTKATDWSPAPEDHYDYADAAQSSAEAYALAKANLAEISAKAYADGEVSAEEARAIADAQAKADAAKAQAIAAAATDATTKANNAQSAAIAAAAADATTKANNAKAQAEANAALDALNKANTAKADAISTASTDATTKANNAKTQAISSAATDATTKANNAQSAAIAAAAADATTKANNAKAQAEANAALDALNKANTAITNAKSDPELANNISTGGLTTIASPEGGSYSVNTANAVGAIKIQLPVGYISTMLSFFVDVFDYRTGYSFTVAISGYCYSTSSVWVNPTAKIIGDNITNYTVRFGDENDKCCIWIAEVNTVFNYPKIVVRDLKCGHGNYSINTWRTGWAVSLVTAFGNVKTTLTNNLVGYADSKAKADAALASAETYALAKANGAETAAINAVSIGNFIADVGLISTLFANSGLFNQLKSRLGSFGGLTAETIAALAIATNHLQAGAVTVDKVSANAITAEKIAALAIATNHLQAGAVTVDKVGANAITAAKIAALAIATNHLQAGAVTVDKVSANAITAEKIAALAIATNHLQAGAVTVDKVSANAITAEKIAALAIATNHLQSGVVTADKITADTALIQKLIANVGLFNQLQAQLGVFGGLAANSIAAKAITASKLVVTGGGTINYDPMLLDADAWAATVGGISFFELSDAPAGKRVLRSNGTTPAYTQDKNYYSIDTSKTYRFRFWARSAAGTNGVLYACLKQYSSIGVPCASNGGRNPYKPGGVSVPTTWTEYSFQWSAGDWQAGVKYVVLDWLLNYGGSAGYIEICYPRLEEMASAELIVDGAITTQKILSKAITTDKIAANAVTATEVLADTALINKLVATSALFDSLVARLAVFGGLTANSIASDAILGRHIKAGEKITSPIIEGGEVRLIGTNAMKIESATPFGPDSLVYWRGPRLLVGGNPDWANIRKSNATRWTDAAGDEYFGGSLSAGVLKTGVTNPDKNPYAASSYPVTIGPFGSNGKAKVVVVSFSLYATSHHSSNPSNPTQPKLTWQLQRKIGSGSWTTVSSGVFNGTVTSIYEAEPPAYWMVIESCSGSFTFTDNTISTSDFNYRVLVVSYSRFHITSNINTQNLTLVSTEQ